MAVRPVQDGVEVVDDGPEVGPGRQRLLERAEHAPPGLGLGAVPGGGERPRQAGPLVTMGLRCGLIPLTITERRTFMATDPATGGDLRTEAVPFFRPGQSYVDRGLLRRQHHTEKAAGIILLACAVVSVLTTFGIVAVLFAQAVKFFAEVPIVDFLTGTQWTALFQNQQEWGVLPLVSATLMVTVLSMLVAVPIGLMSAIYLSEYASPRARSLLKPSLELLAGIPTIIYGFFALTFITPDILKRPEGTPGF